MITFEQVRTAVVLNPGLFQRDFFEWISENFHVFDYFNKSANTVWERGFKHYSARTIVEVMRHRSNIREIGDGEWKLNDHRTPDMARLYMKLHPEREGLFEFRKRKSA
jgi:hypothetical protein